MASFTLQPTVLNWYQYDIAFSMELIRNYIDGIENQVSSSISNFWANKESYILNEIPSDKNNETYCRVIDSHQGLDSQTWDLGSVFTNYFPNLQRKSALITLSGYFEHELNKLCHLYQTEKSYALSLSDLSGKGIYRAVNYLKKVADLNLRTDSKEWNQVKRVQKLRNLIVHQDGSLLDVNGNPIKEITQFIAKSEFLSGEEFIAIHRGFLLESANLYDSVFKLLDKAIKKKEIRT